MDGWRGTGTRGRGGNVYWLERRRTGQKKNDKEMGRGCANGYRNTRQGSWRGFRFGGSRSAREEGVELTHARCSTECRLTEHARDKPKGNGKKSRACSVRLSVS
jgi:hypothetical protein